MNQSTTKFIFVTGGVVSGIGKGLLSASLGMLLQAHGYRVTLMKCDPYINVDPGTMSPLQHGEVFVTEDGAETDLDLGHYERFLNRNLTKGGNITTGSVYLTVIDKERKGLYDGETVQMIPHITNEIKSRIRATAEGFDIAIVEIGGTVGDLESAAFLEAIRQLRQESDSANACCIHVSYVPLVSGSNELKTKPTQHSVHCLLSLGIIPEFIVCRIDQPMPTELRRKLALFCNVPQTHIIENQTIDCIYKLPTSLYDFANSVLDVFRLPTANDVFMKRIQPWERMLTNYEASRRGRVIRIGLVGKYLNAGDTYLSVVEALHHGAYQRHVRLELVHIDSGEVDELDKDLMTVHGVVVPGGFGSRAIEGKISAINYCRTHRIPFLGICLGLQCVTIEYARNVLGLAGANSMEFDPNTPYPVVSLLEEQKEIKAIGGTMRLGGYPCHIKEGTLAHRLYGTTEIVERHRHRFEVNNDYRQKLEELGLCVSGIFQSKGLVEIVELPNHPFFIASQFHPEFKSRPIEPHPLFLGLIDASITHIPSK